MLNRKYIKEISGLSSLLLLSIPAVSQNRPNILYIMSDDHAANAVSAYGGFLSKILPTPNIDNIGKNGAILRSCFATNSISTPSRATILTGQYSHKNGVYTLSDKLDVTKETLPLILRNNGYTTAMFGKWHLVTEPQGFDKYACFIGQGVYNNPPLIENDRTDGKSFEESKGKKYIGNSEDVVASKTIEWLEKERNKTKPFFIMCHFKAPHRNWQPAERFAHLFDGITIPEPSNLYDNYESRGKYTSKIHQGLEIMDSSDVKMKIPSFASRDELRKWLYQRYMKDYLACVAGVDENVGRLVKYLKDNNLYDNTIIIYTSDQGFFLGEHGWFDKRLMQEESIKMPFLISYPKEIKAGSSNNDLIINADFAPTLLDYAGIKVPTDMQGKSFRSNLSGKRSSDWRTSFYYRYYMHMDYWHHSVANLGVRTDRYKLIFYYGDPLNKKGAFGPSFDPEWELYDLKNDPAEMHNLYNKPGYEKITKQLKEEILKLRRELQDNDDESGRMKEIMENYFWK
jgi:arylsulfatase A-like enzyme